MDAINVLCYLIFTLTLIVLVSNVYSIYLGHSDNRYNLFEYLLGATNVFICVALMIFGGWQLYQNNTTLPARETVYLNWQAIDNPTFNSEENEIIQDDDKWAYNSYHETPYNSPQKKLSSFQTQGNNNNRSNANNNNIYAKPYHHHHKPIPTITITKPDDEDEEKGEDLTQYQDENAARPHRIIDQVYEYNRCENPLTATKYNQISSFQNQITKNGSPNNDNDNYATINRGYYPHHQVVPTTNVTKTEKIELSTFKPITTTTTNNNNNNSKETVNIFPSNSRVKSNNNKHHLSIVNEEEEEWSDGSEIVVNNNSLNYNDDNDDYDDVVVEEERIYETVPDNDIIMTSPELKNTKDKSKKKNNDNNYHHHTATENHIEKDDDFEIIGEYYNDDDEYYKNHRHFDQYSHNNINSLSLPKSINQHYPSTSYYNNNDNNNIRRQSIYSEPVDVAA